MTDYTPCMPIDCGYAPEGACSMNRAQAEVVDKMKLIEMLGKKKGGSVNAFYKPGIGWKVSYTMR